MNQIFPKVFVIILNYNGGRTILDCLRRVYQMTYPNFEVVMVDNNSTDGSLETAKQAFSRAHFIKSERNLGFGAGNNLGIRFALEKMADFVFLLNNDAFVEAETLAELLEVAATDPKIGMTAPLILNAKLSLWFERGRIDWWRMRCCHIPALQLKTPYPSEYLTGCALLIRKEVFSAAGLFDERFFLYYEDADLSLRARKNGFSLLVVPVARVIHAEQSENAAARKVYWLALSGLIFFDTHTAWWRRPWQALYYFGRRIKNRFDRQRRLPTADHVFQAYADFRRTRRA